MLQILYLAWIVRSPCIYYSRRLVFYCPGTLGFTRLETLYLLCWNLLIYFSKTFIIAIMEPSFWNICFTFWNLFVKREISYLLSWNLPFHYPLFLLCWYLYIYFPRTFIFSMLEPSFETFTLLYWNLSFFFYSGTVIYAFLEPSHLLSFVFPMLEHSSLLF